MAKRVTRTATLTNTASGVAGEMRVAAELCRFGFHVARPCWNDDEIDLLVFLERQAQLVPIPIQVKSVQFPIATVQQPDPKCFVSGLKKRYIEANEWLCLAIYNPASDCFWFIDGADNVKNAYMGQSSWHKHVAYDKLTSNDDVRIGCSQKGTTKGSFDQDYKVPQGAAIWWTDRLTRIADKIAARKSNIDIIKAAMGW